MNACEPPVLLHNMSTPPRTQVNTTLPALCEQKGGLAPLFSLPHALVLAGDPAVEGTSDVVLSPGTAEGAVEIQVYFTFRNS
jgi:hypothetical protein